MGKEGVMECFLQRVILDGLQRDSILGNSMILLIDEKVMGRIDEMMHNPRE
jgi:hypothetical protein